MLDSGWADEVSTGFVGVLLDCSLEEPASVKLLGLAGLVYIELRDSIFVVSPDDWPPSACPKPALVRSFKLCRSAFRQC